MNKTLLLSAAPVLVLVACNGTDQEPVAESAEPPTVADNDGGMTGGPGTYYYADTRTGAVISFELPADPEHEYIEPLEDYRHRVSSVRTIDDASYVLVNIDNTEGVGQAQVPTLSVVTDDGDTVTYEEQSWVVGEWMDRVPMDNTRLYNQGVDLNNSRLGDNSALPGAVTTTALIAPDEPSSIARVFADAFFDEPVEIFHDPIEPGSFEVTEEDDFWDDIEFDEDDEDWRKD